MGGWIFPLYYKRGNMQCIKWRFRPHYGEFLKRGKARRRMYQKALAKSTRKD